MPAGWQGGRDRIEDPDLKPTTSLPAQFQRTHEGPTCSICGAVVGDMGRHRNWHSEIERRR